MKYVLAYLLICQYPYNTHLCDQEFDRPICIAKLNEETMVYKDFDNKVDAENYMAIIQGTKEQYCTRIGVAVYKEFK